MKKTFIFITCAFSLHAMELSNNELAPTTDANKLIEHLQALIKARQQDITNKEAECTLLTGVIWQAQNIGKQQAEAAQAYKAHMFHRQKMESEKQTQLIELQKQYEQCKAQLEKEYAAKVAPVKAQESQAIQRLNIAQHQQEQTCGLALSVLSNIQQQTIPIQTHASVQPIAKAASKVAPSGSSGSRSSNA